MLLSYYVASRKNSKISVFNNKIGRKTLINYLNYLMIKLW